MNKEGVRGVLLSTFVAALLLWSASFISKSTRAQNSQSDLDEVVALGGESHVHGSCTIGSLAGSTTCPRCGGTGKVTCPDCNGTGGERACSWCGGTGVEECLTCHGTGRCFACNGTGKCQACESWYAVYDTPCPTCGGTGLCSVCDGTGLCYACDGLGGKTCWKCGGTGREGTCPHCGGTGKVECPTCGGTGVITTEEEEEPPTPGLWASVTHIRGEVKILRNGEEITTTPLLLQAQDEIRTGDDGQIEIALLDGTKICIAPNCCFVFRKLEEELMKGETFWGKIWAFISGKSCQIETRSAVTSVRGTEFTLEVAEDGTTTLTVLEGTVELSDLALTESVLVGQYQTSVVTPGGTPSSPASIGPIEIDRWWEWGAEEVPLNVPLAVAIMVISVIVVQPKKRPVSCVNS